MTALYPMAWAIFATLLFVGAAVVRVWLEGGAIDATGLLRVWPVTLIIAGPVYLLMIWWAFRNWRE